MTAVSAGVRARPPCRPPSAGSRAASPRSASPRPSPSTRRPRRSRPRQAGHRLRRRRARLPDAGLHRRGGRRGLPPAGHAPVHPGRRAARAEGRDRREDRTRLRPAGHRRPTCWSPTAASRRSTRPSPRCSTRATRCWCRRRTGRRTRRPSGWPVGCRCRSSPTSRAATWSSAAQLEAARTPRTKVLLFCSPSNPTGAVYPPEQVEEIGRWALDAGLWVLTDEIYEHLTYGGVTAPSMPVVVPELADRCVVVNGVAKTYAMTGWRVGWMVGPADVVKAATNLQSHATSNVANVSQAAAVAALTGDLSAVADDARGLRPPPADHRLDAARDPGHRLPGAAGRLLRLPVGEGSARPADRRADRRDQRGAGHADPGGGRGRRRPGRGLRHARATSGCPTRSATTTWSRASRACSGCSRSAALGWLVSAGERPPGRAPAARLQQRSSAAGSPASAAPTSSGVAMDHALAST